MLFAAGDDGTLCVFEIKEGKSAGKKEVATAFAEEILVTKTDLEEKASMLAEYKSRVDELELANDYQMKLREIQYTERIREVQDKFTQQLEQDKAKYELLKDDKADMEMEYEEKVKALEHNEVATECVSGLMR